MKTILISGATAGIGEATARLAAKQNHKVLLIGRRKEKLESLVHKIGKNSSYAQLDVSDKNAVDKFFANLPDGFKSIDVLVNNAGLALSASPAPKIDIDDWETMVSTNINGMMRMAHRSLEKMSFQNKGHIVNISSISSHLPYKGGNVYGATKAFVSQFSKNLRTDLLGKNIRVTDILPGAVETDFSNVRFKGDEQKAKSVYANYRPLKPEDVAEAILWAIDRPEHVNIDSLEIMPTDQTYGGSATTASK